MGTALANNLVLDELQEQPATSSFSARFVELEVLRAEAPRRVVRAYDNTLRREVVLKEIHVHAREHAEHARLVEATQAMARMKHPHVAKLYGVQILPDMIVLATEAIVGPTLGEWMRPREPPLWRDVVRLFLQAGEGISSAHSHGLVHGGLHPGNIFVTDTGAVVTDFGVSARRDEDVLPYLAPERQAGDRSEARADQYAFCVLLWQALCGTAPFSASPGEGTNLRGTPVWPRQVRVPRKLVDVLVRGVCTASVRPFDDMEALLLALADAMRKTGTNRAMTTAALPSALFCGAGLWVWQAERAQVCTGAAALLQGIWGPEARARLEEAMLRTRVPYAPETFERVQHSLSTYADSWAHQHQEVCEATALREEQTAEVLDLRMSCLQRARLELQSAVELLINADAQVVERAVDVATALPPLDRCGDVEALRMLVPPPADPEDARKVEAARAELSGAGALERSGKYEEALTRVLRARAHVEDAEYQPVQAEIAYAEGLLLDHLGRYAKAEQALNEAVAVALSSGATAVAVQAASRAGVLLSSRVDRPAESRWPAMLALAAAKGLQEEPVVHGGAYNSAGAVLLRARRCGEAEAAFRKSLELRESMLGPKHPLVADALHNIAAAMWCQGRPADAEALSRQTLEMRKEIVGARHPQVAQSLQSLAVGLKDQGRYAEAESCMREAASIVEATLPPEHPQIGKAYNDIAFLLLRQGQYDAAAHELHRALDHWLQFTPHESTIGFAYDNLGLVNLFQNRYVEAEQEFRRSIEFRQRVLGAEHHDVPEAQIHLGQALAGQDRLLEARTELEAALEHLRRVYGSEHPRIAEASTALAHVLLELRLAPQARALLEHAWNIQSRTPVAAEHRAETAYSLAQILWEANADTTRARDLAARAKLDYEAAGQLWRDEAREAEQWLEEHA